MDYVCLTNNLNDPVTLICKNQQIPIHVYDEKEIEFKSFTTNSKIINRLNSLNYYKASQAYGEKYNFHTKWNKLKKIISSQSILSASPGSLFMGSHLPLLPNQWSDIQSLKMDQILTPEYQWNVGNAAPSNEWQSFDPQDGYSMLIPQSFFSKSFYKLEKGTLVSISIFRENFMIFSNSDAKFDKNENLHKLSRILQDLWKWDSGEIVLLKSQTSDSFKYLFSSPNYLISENFNGFNEFIQDSFLCLINQK